MPKFVPLSTLKDTTFICDMCQQIKEPIFVTRNGYTELVIMSSEFFNEHMRYRDSNGNVDYSKEYIGVPYSFPIKTLKLTSEVSLRCSKTDAPISVIKNGYEVMVIMSQEHYTKRINDLFHVQYYNCVTFFVK